VQKQIKPMPTTTWEDRSCGKKEPPLAIYKRHSLRKKMVSWLFPGQNEKQLTYHFAAMHGQGMPQDAPPPSRKSSGFEKEIE